MEGIISPSTEIIADSEDEGMLLGSPRKADMIAGRGRDVSMIQTANFSTRPGPGPSHITSDISSFTHHSKELSLPPIAILPSAEDITTSTTPPPATKPRPRPRLKKIPAAAEGQAGSSSSNTNPQDTSISTPSTSITTPAPSSSNVSRPRPRPRMIKAPATIMDGFSVFPSKPDTNPIATASTRIQGNTSIIEDPADFSLDIAERAKMRSRARTSKPTGDVIEISDDDELSFLPPAKPKGKAKDVPKKPSKRAKPSRGADSLLPESTPGSLPAPTSDFSLHLESLPPSDPPIPSTGPPGLTPPDVPRPGGRGSSPPLSPALNLTRKRKRVAQLAGSDDDEPSGAAVLKPTSGSMMPPPPPPFFASSSSASGSSAHAPAAIEGLPESAGPAAAAPVAAPKKRNPRKRKVADEEEDAFNPNEEPPKSKAKGRRNKKDEEDEEEFGAKPKAKPKRKPAAKAKAKKSDARVEVVVEVPSPRKRTKSNDVVPETQPGPVVVLRPDDARPEITSGPQETQSGSTSALPGAKAQAKSATSAGKHKGKEPAVTEVGPSKGSKTSNPPSSKSKGKRRAIESSDEDEEDRPPSNAKGGKASSSKKDATPSVHSNSQSSTTSGVVRTGSLKENGDIEAPAPPPSPQPLRTPVPQKPGAFSRANSTIPNKLTPMSELIRKVNSLPGSPFASARPAHSPYMKSSRSMLKRIAPLHPNRRTPPPPPPRAPPPKKSKKELEREEKWEQELEDSIDGWYALPEDERATLRKAKRNQEMGFDD